jgi:hypothetical protein
MTHKLIWNLTKPVSMLPQLEPGEQLIMLGWWPSRIKGYDIAGRPLANGGGKG